MDNNEAPEPEVSEEELARVWREKSRSFTLITDEPKSDMTSIVDVAGGDDVLLRKLPLHIREHAQKPPPTEEDLARAEYEEWEAEQRDKRLKQLREKSNLPGRYERMTFESFKAERAGVEASKSAKICAKYAKSHEKHLQDGSGLYLVGNVGTGKTHLAVAIMHYLMDRGVPCLFVAAPDFLEAMREEYREASSESHAEPAGWARMASEAPVLILDDLGAERATEWAREKMFTLVNERYRKERPTIYTSNVFPDKLRYDQRTISRIMGSSDSLEVKGPDQRVRKG